MADAPWTTEKVAAEHKRVLRGESGPCFFFTHWISMGIKSMTSHALILVCLDLDGCYSNVSQQ